MRFMFLKIFSQSFKKYFILVVLSCLVFLLFAYSFQKKETMNPEDEIIDQIKYVYQSTMDNALYLLNSLQTGGRISLKQATENIQEKENSLEIINKKIDQTVNQLNVNNKYKIFLQSKTEIANMALSYISEAIAQTNHLMPNDPITPIYNDLNAVTRILNSPEASAKKPDINHLKNDKSLQLDSEKLKHFSF